MDILIVNSTDFIGGAAKAAFRLHKGFESAGINSNMLVREQAYKLSSIHCFRQFDDRVRSRLNRMVQEAHLFAGGGTNSDIFHAPKYSLYPLRSNIDKLPADIVNLHWVSDGMVVPSQLLGIRQPIVWTLHDMWPFTGGCHYDQECGAYTSGCGNCPLLKRPSPRDLSFRHFSQKRAVYPKLDLSVVSPSNWLAEVAISSGLFDESKVHVIPIGIDEQVFKPIDRNAARHAWNLPLDKKIVLFGAVGALADQRKGFDLITDAMEIMGRDSNRDLQLVVFGAGSNRQAYDFGFPVHYIDFIYDEISLALMYSAADVMLVPSRQEAFGLTSLEAMACGTPVAAFAIGGLLDMITHQHNGYLAQPFDAADLAHGLEWMLNDAERTVQLGENARRTALDKFSIATTANRYEALFNSLLDRDGQNQSARIGR